MRTLLPADSEVHLFGTTSANRGRFSGPVVGKIESLAADLKEGLAPRFSALKFERGDYGDHGLDIVGWAPWPDAARGLPISFAQCACTSEWISKQASSGFDRWSQVITFEVRPHNTCFIPFDFRSDDNDWYADHDIHSTILIDRRRFFQRTGFLDGDTPLPALTDAFIASLGVKAVMAGKLQDLQDI